MAPLRAHLSRRCPPLARLNVRVRVPLISIKIDHRATPYAAGETLHGEYQIDAVETDELRAVELSALWYTEGKGEEDLGIHHFERHTGDGEGQPSLTELAKFAFALPNSPLSYEGVLVKLRWCVRLRVFLKSGRSYSAELPFRLGAVPDAQPVPAENEMSEQAEAAAGNGAVREGID
jgi:hypothetical protein